MANEYVFNTKLLRYEKKKRSFQKIVLTVVLVIALYAGGIFGFMWISIKFWNTPRERILLQQQKYLQSKYDKIQLEINRLDNALSAIEKKDNEVYRSIFEVSPIPYDVRVKNLQKASLTIQELSTDSSELLQTIGEQMKEISGRLEAQKKSLQQIAVFARDKSSRLKAIPAIQPISNKQLIRLSSGFGYRIDPIYKVIKKHEGVDFTAPTGTPVYATANGTVEYSGFKFNGYGKHVIISHGYGYKTMYSHLSKIKARAGSKVTRGELIGWVGSTGKSTAPHLHYEVIVNNQKVNPIYFFYSDLNEKEFEQLLELAQLNNQSFD